MPKSTPPSWIQVQFHISGVMSSCAQVPVAIVACQNTPCAGLPLCALAVALQELLAPGQWQVKYAENE